MDKMIVSDVVKTLEKRNFLTRKPHSGRKADGTYSVTSIKHVIKYIAKAEW